MCDEDGNFCTEGVMESVWVSLRSGEMGRGLGLRAYRNLRSQVTHSEMPVLRCSAIRKFSKIRSVNNENARNL